MLIVRRPLALTSLKGAGAVSKNFTDSVFTVRFTNTLH